MVSVQETHFKKPIRLSILRAGCGTCGLCRNARLPAARRYELRQEHPQALGFLLLMEAAVREYGRKCGW